MLSCNSNQEAESTAASATEESKNTAETAPSTKPKKADAPRNSGVTELAKEFPQFYIDAGLPVWEKATVEKVNKVENGDDVKYQIMLTSTEDIHSIAESYDEAMKKQGWTAMKQPAQAQNDDRRTLSFKKGDEQFIINALALPNQEKKIITLLFKEGVK